MIVLLTGANGFIGRHLTEALLAAGHTLTVAVRDAARHRDARVRAVQADFTAGMTPSDWVPLLADVEVVINAVGIIREQGRQTFDAIHVKGPAALFAACVEAGVHRVIQISALGADAQAQSAYHLSKKRADDFLAGLPLHAVIVQPSLVFGTDGASARLFCTMASLPQIALPGSGGQQIQPVHVDDVAGGIAALLECPVAAGTRVPAVGPGPMSLRDFLTILRQSMGLGRARFVPVPMPLVRAAAAAGRLLPGSLLDTETLQMLERGNTADAAALTRLLGRPPRAADSFIGQGERRGLRLSAQASWLLPVLRLSIAFVWILTGIVSFGLYPVGDSYALLAHVGIGGWLAPVMLYGAASLDLAFGVATLVLQRRRLLWLAQLATIIFYTVIISWRLPEFWLHPYGPLSKNLPMMAAIWLLLVLEEGR